MKTTVQEQINHKVKQDVQKVAYLAVDRVEQIRGIVKHYLDTEQIMFPRLSPKYSQGADRQETDERKGGE